SNTTSLKILFLYRILIKLPLNVSLTYTRSSNIFASLSKFQSRIFAWWLITHELRDPCLKLLTELHFSFSLSFPYLYPIAPISQITDNENVSFFLSPVHMRTKDFQNYNTYTHSLSTIVAYLWKALTESNHR